MFSPNGTLAPVGFAHVQVVVTVSFVWATIVLSIGSHACLSKLKSLMSDATRFEPKLPAPERDKKLAAWRKAVKAVIAFYAG